MYCKPRPGLPENREGQERQAQGQALAGAQGCRAHACSHHCRSLPPGVPLPGQRPMCPCRAAASTKTLVSVAALVCAQS